MGIDYHLNVSFGYRCEVFDPSWSVILVRRGTIVVLLVKTSTLLPFKDLDTGADDESHVITENSVRLACGSLPDIWLKEGVSHNDIKTSLRNLGVFTCLQTEV